jgi:hypothetical protein
MRRWLAAMIVVAVAMTLGGCTVTESRNEEYRAEAEALSDRLLARVPADRIEGDVFTSITMSSPPQTLGSGDAIWWNVDRELQLVDEPDVSARTAELVADALLDEGWTYRRAREMERGARIADGYRLDGWYVELQWTVTGMGNAESLTILVTSPATPRGTERPTYVE